MVNTRVCQLFVGPREVAYCDDTGWADLCPERSAACRALLAPDQLL